jgi:delta 1-pyrroline-5-carboxylate dehydrogenase
MSLELKPIGSIELNANLSADDKMKFLEQLIELFSGHSKTLTDARNSLEKAIEENREATDRLRHLAAEESCRIEEMDARRKRPD